jgi:hypothetical protein
MNGLPELLCPELPWKSSEVNPGLRILGKLGSGGVADIANATPSNADYAEYLGDLYSTACANEEQFLNELRATK